jgi:hypothetical protein
MHDERYFSNPYSFIPERWIEREGGARLLSKKRISHFLLVDGIVLDDRMFLLWVIVDHCSLAALVMRVTPLRYEFALKYDGQQVPAHRHLTPSSGPLELRITGVEGIRKTCAPFGL